MKYFARALLASCALWLAASTAPAAASGPVERIVQVMPKPGKPDSLVVRYGVATHGFLYSEDGGKSFAAACLAAVQPETAKTYSRLSKITTRPVAGVAPVAMDGAGRVMFSQYGSFWTNDGTGCNWSRITEFDDRWAFSIKSDPVDANVIWAAVSTTTGDGTSEAKSDVEVWRRDAEGRWTIEGTIVKTPAGKILYDGDLVVSVIDGTRQFYASINVYGVNSVGLLESSQHLMSSADGAKSWVDTRLPDALENLNLLAVDPSGSERLLAVLSNDNAPDRLMISNDRGRSFQDYLPGLRAVSGITFDPSGRVFVGDAGDATGDDTVGGLYSAAKLGEPLTKIAGTSTIDCVHHDAQTGKLYVCQAEKVGVADLATGNVSVLVSLPKVPELLICPGRDLVDECKAQLNDGPSWCCAGHFPFTPFCGQYDVTMVGPRRVFCGKSGREYDSPSPSEAAETMSLELEAPGEEVTSSTDDATPPAPRSTVVAQGCSLPAGRNQRSALYMLFAGMSVLVMMTRRARRRR